MAKYTFSRILLAMCLTSPVFASGKSFEVEYTLSNYTEAPIEYSVSAMSPQIDMSKLEIGGSKPIMPDHWAWILGNFTVNGPLNPAGTTKSIHISAYQGGKLIFQQYITPTPFRGALYSKPNTICKIDPYFHANNITFRKRRNSEDNNYPCYIR